MKLHEEKEEFKELIALVAAFYGLPEPAIERDYYIVEIKRRIPYIKINGDLKNRVVSNANISFAGIAGEDLLNELSTTTNS